MKINYTYNEMKRAFETGRNFQLTGENNFQELIEELNQALTIPTVVVSDKRAELCKVCNNDQVFETEDGYIADCPKCN